MAILGQQLTAPESGWRRYDDYNVPFTKSENWRISGSSAHYGDNGTTISSSSGDYLKFKFKGTKIRILCYVQQSDASSGSIDVNIDGVSENFTANNIDLGIETYQYTTLVYEKLNLNKDEHEVVITNNENKDFMLDAIDIDADGRLLHPTLEEVFDPKDLDTGKCIRCHYTATSNSVGAFSGLGEETSDLIPPESSATPDGDFFFICVGYDHLGRKKLIADRNIQHSISWDSINSVGAVNGLPLDLIPSNENVAFETRLMTGGVSSTDKENEWDKIIVEYDLGGLIPPGDNVIWNWRSTASMTSTRVGGNLSVARGYDLVSSWWTQGDTNLGTAVADPTWGYRPVLLVESLFTTKYLVEDGTDIKYHDGTNWVTVGLSPVTQLMFNDYGMEDLSSIASNAGTLTSTNPKVLINSNTDLTNLTVGYEPDETLVLANGDILLNDISNIDNFNLTATGDVGIIVSADSGVSWKAFSQVTSEWVDVDITDDLAVQNLAMTITEFNALTTEWNNLITNNTVRFGYLLKTSSDLVDELTVQVDMQGEWGMSIPGTDYTYAYNNEGLKVSLLTDGSYKINY